MIEYSKELSPNERIVDVTYPNGKKAFLVYTRVGNSWVSVLGEDTMEDLQNIRYELLRKNK